MRTKVWVVTELYYPEETSTGYFMTGIAECLASDTSVRVLSVQPTYSSRGIIAPRRERRNDVDIQRCWATTLDKDVLLFRVINMATVAISIFFGLLTRLRRGHIVIAVTNPPSLPFLTWLACRMRGARLVLLIHDVYPEVLVVTGILRSGSLLTSLGEMATRSLYRHTERIVVLGRDMRSRVEKKINKADVRIQIIPNWGDIDGVFPCNRGSNPFLQSLGLLDKFVVQYCGNMGRTHGIEVLLRTAAELKGWQNLHFLFCGWGAKRRQIEDAISSGKFKNLSLVAPQPQEHLRDLLNACDVSVLSFVAGMSGISVPSRLYNVLASGKPLIVVGEADSEAAQLVREEEVGWVVPPDRPDLLAHAITEASSDPSRLLEMGRKARKTAEDKYSFQQISEAYRTLLSELADGIQRSDVDP